MKLVRGAAPLQSAVETAASAAVDSAVQATPAEVRQHVVALNKDLQDAANKFERLQAALVTQQHLEQLLREGRAHLQDLRTRLQEMTAERDVLQTALSDHATAHRLEIERLQGQIQEDASHALAQRTLAEQHERDMLSKLEEQRPQIDALRRQAEKVTVERDRLVKELELREASEKQVALERAEQRSTFERLLAEARSNQREMAQELDEQSQQNGILREAAMRAQSLARQIMNAREPSTPENGSRD